MLNHKATVLPLQLQLDDVLVGVENYLLLAAACAPVVATNGVTATVAIRDEDAPNYSILIHWLDSSDNATLDAKGVKYWNWHSVDSHFIFPPASTSLPLSGRFRVYWDNKVPLF